MVLFKIVQEVLCLCLMEEIIDEEEFVLLYEAYRPSNLPFPHSAYEKFFGQKEGCAMHECWLFLICMMIWKILLSVQLEEKCVYMVTQPTHLGSTSKPLSEMGF